MTIDAPSSLRAAAERAAFALGAQGLELRDEDTGERAGRVSVRLWVPADIDRDEVTASVRAHVEDARLAFREVRSDWTPAPPPRRVGRRVLVVADDERHDTQREVVRLDASLTFGDGLHDTTALCVSALERAFASARRAPRSVLDVGTGSGILAIVAARFGAERVVATDVDPLALASARANAARNGVRCSLHSRLPRARFDLVIANLYFDPLRALSRDLAARVAPSGRLVVSGFSAENARAIEDAFAAAGLVRDARHRRGRWALLELAHTARRTRAR